MHNTFSIVSITKLLFILQKAQETIPYPSTCSPKAMPDTVTLDKGTKLPGIKLFLLDMLVDKAPEPKTIG